jgi:hypothetical protein
VQRIGVFGINLQGQRVVTNGFGVFPNFVVRERTVVRRFEMFGVQLQGRRVVFDRGMKITSFSVAETTVVVKISVGGQNGNGFGKIIDGTIVGI